MKHIGLHCVQDRCPLKVEAKTGIWDKPLQVTLNVRQIFFIRKWAKTWVKENLRWYWKAKKMSKQSKELAARLKSREPQGSESWQGRSMWWENGQILSKTDKRHQLTNLEAQWTASRINTKKPILKHIINYWKLGGGKGGRATLKSNYGKEKKYILGKNNRNNGWFIIRNNESQKTTEHHLSSSKRNYQPRILHLGKHTSKMMK